MERILAKRPSPMVILCLIILIGAIGRGYLLLKMPPWIDETFTLRTIRMGFPALWSGYADPVHPPGYYTFLKIFSLLNRSLTGLRMVSVLLYFSNTALLFYLSAKTAGRKYAMITVFLYAFSGYFAVFDWQIRMYTMLSTAILLSLYISSKVEEDRRFLLPLVAVDAIGPFIDYGYLFYLIPVILLRAWVWVMAKDKRNPGHFLAPCISFLIFIAIWGPVLAANMQKGIQGIAWLSDYTISYFFGPFFLGTFNQFAMTCLTAALFMGGAYFCVTSPKKGLAGRILFVAAFSLSFAKLVTIFYTPFVHVRSLLIVPLSIIVLQALFLRKISVRHRKATALALFLYAVNYYLTVSGILSHPGMYLISFGH